ncbi:MAG: acyl-CoA dehydrogenase family protein [Halioglobus sp.]|nr:acyl-CoA dehydrogenase family protein [Halioglobus sp.]
MSAALTLDYDEDQQAIGAAIDRFCEQRDVAGAARRGDGVFPHELWRALAELGVFAAGAPHREDAGDAQTLCAIAEALGRNVFPGPVADTFLALQVLDREAAEEVIAGRALVAVSRGGTGLFPWGLEADLFLVVNETAVARVDTPADLQPLQTLGGEIWGRGATTASDALAGSARALTIGNIAAAAYLAGAGLRLVRETGDYVAARRQFGRTLGEFQAVAHPLADCAIAVTAAQHLARAAACSVQAQPRGSADGRAATLAAGAALSAGDAALRAAYTCHQAYGAIGVTVEGPAFHFSRRIRHLATQATAGAREQDLLLAEAGLGAQ